MSSNDVTTGPCEFPWEFGRPCGKPGSRHAGEGSCNHPKCTQAKGHLYLGGPPSFAFYSCEEHAVADISSVYRAGAFLCADHAPR
ncbi:MAG: hypothetical protein HYR85_21710 [Planctomycetes bacterium]|nr:hypothetical protein [Planctomycetota bacterium]MBI3848586.1 hypothetical protein [Planctomycetota bacterium]